MDIGKNSVAVWDHLPPISDRVGMTATSESTASSLVGSKAQEKMDKSPGSELLKPVQKHMQTIEAKRAMLIMDTCIAKVLLVAAFPKIVENIGDYELLLGREVKMLFEEYGKTAKKYEEVVEKSPVDCQKLQKVKDRLFNVTRQITRCMVAEPVVAQSLIQHYREWRVEPQTPLRELASQLVQLRIILRQILLVSPKESAARDEYIERATIQSSKQGALLKKLKERLEALTEEHNEIAEEKIKEIEQLNARLLATESEAIENIKGMRERYMKEHRDAWKKHKKNMQILTEDSAAARKMYEEEVAAHRSRELAIRRQKWRLEDQLDGIIKNMDDQLFDLQFKYDETKRQYDEEMQAYEYLKAKFEPLKVEYDSIMEARAREEEARLQAIREQEEMVKSATFITSLYRAFKARARIRAERRARRN